MSFSSSQGSGIGVMTRAAEGFLAAQSWCAQVHSATPVFGIEGVVGVFRCTLMPSHPDADMMVWVVVGDLPPAYLVHEPGDSWQDALAAYVDEMGRWVAAVRSGESPGDDIIPVNVAPTLEHAELLASRLEFIRERLVEVDPDSVERDI
jgi:hypothetical protein